MVVSPLELEPGQPQAVAAAITKLLAQAEPRIDPWWAAGIEEALGAWVTFGAFEVGDADGRAGNPDSRVGQAGTALHGIASDALAARPEGAAASGAYGAGTARPRRTRGAERA